MSGIDRHARIKAIQERFDGVNVHKAGRVDVQDVDVTDLVNGNASLDEMLNQIAARILDPDRKR
jgi:hypothetical protein